MKPHLVLNDEEKQQRFDDKYVVANADGVGGVVGDDVGYGLGDSAGDGVGDDSDVAVQV